MNVLIVLMCEDERLPSIYVVDMGKIPDDTSLKRAILNELGERDDGMEGNLVDDGGWFTEEEWFKNANVSFPCYVEAEANIFY